MRKSIVTGLLFVGLATAACSRGVEGYAPTKHRLCVDCDLKGLPFERPARGLIAAYGSFIGPTASWRVVDLDRRRLSIVSARFDPPSKLYKEVQKKDVVLHQAEVKEVVAAENALWALEEPVGSSMATDVVWDLYLLDRGAVCREFGPGSPLGAGKELEALIEKLHR